MNQDAFGCLREETSCFNLFVIVCTKCLTRRNKKTPKAKNVSKRLPGIIVLFSLYMANTKSCLNKNYGENLKPNTEKRVSSFSATTANRKRCLKHDKSLRTANSKNKVFFDYVVRRTGKGAFKKIACTAI